MVLFMFLLFHEIKFVIDLNFSKGTPLSIEEAFTTSKFQQEDWGIILNDMRNSVLSNLAKFTYFE